MSHRFAALFFTVACGLAPAVSFSQGPVPGPGGTGGSPYGGGAVYSAPDSTQAFGTGDPTYPYDYPAPWMHGYYQEIPAYHGHHFFRPYNYKHVLPQSQTAAAWGLSPNMPISHPNFDRVNGVPANAPITSYRSGADDIRSQFAKIDGQRGVSKQRRQGPQLAATQQVPRRSTQPNVMQTRHQQPPRLTRAEALRQQIDRLNSELEQEEGGQ